MNSGPDPSGYLHRSYAESFAEIAKPRELPHCGGWVLERVIPGSALRDGMGCYPLFACRRWQQLPQDLTPLTDRLVSLSLVTDPFGQYTEDDLKRSFDVVRRYKPHFITDLQEPIDRTMPRRHRRNTAASLRVVRLETCREPSRMLDEWLSLYEQLVERHRISGITAFSPTTLAMQLHVPGLMMFKASTDGEVVGLHLWYIQEDVAYGHLGATSARGYEVMASYALYWYAIEQLRGQVRWLDLGASAGVSEAASGRGLRDFKAGWSTGFRWALLCGRILQPDIYAALVAERGIGATAYFPAYRLGEFTNAARGGESIGVPPPC